MRYQLLPSHMCKSIPMPLPARYPHSHGLCVPTFCRRLLPDERLVEAPLALCDSSVEAMIAYCQVLLLLRKSCTKSKSGRDIVVKHIQGEYMRCSVAKAM